MDPLKKEIKITDAYGEFMESDELDVVRELLAPQVFNEIFSPETLQHVDLVALLSALKQESHAIQKELISDTLTVPHIKTYMEKTFPLHKIDVFPSLPGFRDDTVGDIANEGYSNATCLLSIAHNLIIDEKKMKNVHYGGLLEYIMKYPGMTTIEQMTHALTGLASTLVPFKGDLGTIQYNPDLGAAEAQSILTARKAQNKVYLIDEILLHQLVNYEFDLDVDLKHVSDIGPFPVYSGTVTLNRGLYQLQFSYPDCAYSGTDDAIQSLISEWQIQDTSREVIYVQMPDDGLTVVNTFLKLCDWKGGDLTLNRLITYGPIQAKLIDRCTNIFKKMAFEAKKVSQSKKFFDLYVALCVAVTHNLTPDEFDQVLSLNKHVIAGMSKHFETNRFSTMVDTYNADKTRVKLAELYKQMVRRRAEGKMFRNVGAREFISKGVADLTYPDGPSAFRVAGKFDMLVTKFPDIYASDCDVFGTAKMAFKEAISANRNTKVSPGKRIYYDKAPVTGLKTPVTSMDIYALASEVHRDTKFGVSIIDDCDQSYPEELVARHGAYEVKYGKSDMWHKMRAIVNAGYKSGYVKMMLDKTHLRDNREDPLWKVLSMYETFVFQSVGKQQSAEFFIVFDNFKPPLDKDGNLILKEVINRSEKIYSKWISFVRTKCASMRLFDNMLMYCTVLGRNVGAQAFVDRFENDFLAKRQTKVEWNNVMGIIPKRGDLCYKGQMPFKVNPTYMEDELADLDFEAV